MSILWVKVDEKNEENRFSDEVGLFTVIWIQKYPLLLDILIYKLLFSYFLFFSTLLFSSPQFSFTFFLIFSIICYKNIFSLFSNSWLNYTESFNEYIFTSVFSVYFPVNYLVRITKTENCPYLKELNFMRCKQ